jgi:anthranilate/para-aminobenzoate synthase component I
MLLEDGAGRAGRARLAWGARRHHRLQWSSENIGSLDWLAGLSRDGASAYGVLAYDLGLPPKARRAEPPVAQPLAEFFTPEREVVIDLETGRVVSGEMPEVDGSDGIDGSDVRVGGAVVSAASVSLLSRSFDQPTFESGVRRIKDYIAAGDVYQVNLAVAERFAVELSAWDIYLRLRQVNPSPWMGFADFGDWQVVSGSPELLVEVVEAGEEGEERVIRTRPIAGTRKKTGDPVQDAAMRVELALDEKEQAEHRMLLDLARNDLGRVSRFGTVVVSEREVIEEYSHVFHLVSEVRGVLNPGSEPEEAVAALFPGGTITGTPKIRAMEVIAELEPVARGAYTGAMGWIGGEGMQLNILIRSAVVRDGVACVQAGSGIVWDSDPAREWRESLRKGAAMRAALGARSL